MARATISDLKRVSGIVAWTLAFVIPFFGSLWLYTSNRQITLQEKARRGDQIEVKIDPKVCPMPALGELTCEFLYVGRYDLGTNGWALRGRSNWSDKMATNTLTNAPNKLGSISVWGIDGTFDNDGRLFVKNKEVGRIRATESVKW
jgi:hypothetical protein